VSEQATEPAPSLDDPPHDDGAAERTQRKAWREFPILIGSALVLAIVIKTFLIQAFFIPSESMVPTLRQGDRILVCRICTRVGGVHRGEVVVFSDPHPGPGSQRGALDAALHWLAEGIGVAQPENPDYVKRVIGLGGDVVELRSGRLYVNGSLVPEPYLDTPRDTRSFGPITVPDGMLFVLGDNRLHSGDSRFQPPEGLGFVGQDKVIGRAFVRVWPPSRMGWVR
jgi:signal peptidase I